jgi:hypothetical protein
MQFRSDWSAIWLYNPRVASLRHGFEEPGDVQDIRLVIDTIPTLAGPLVQTVRQSFFQSALAGLIRVYLQRKLWDWGWEVVRAFRIPVGVLISIFQHGMTRTTLHRFAFCWDMARSTALLETADSDGN